MKFYLPTGDYVEGLESRYGWDATTLGRSCGGAQEDSERLMLEGTCIWKGESGRYRIQEITNRSGRASTMFILERKLRPV